MRDQELQKKIMRRVRFIYLVKKGTGKAACRIYALSAVLLALQPFVSFVQVIKNMPRALDPTYYYNFVMGAFMHTELIVKVLLVIAIGTVAWMIIDGLRNITLYAKFKRI